MRREKVLATRYSSWSSCIIGVVLLVGLAAPLPRVGEATQVETQPPALLTSSSVKVSVAGNTIRIETAIPVVIDVKPLTEAPAGDLESTKPRAKPRFSRGELIIVAPTP